MASILLALILPVTDLNAFKPAQVDASQSSTERGQAKEDLQQFLHGTRWGVSLAEVRRAKMVENGQQTAQSQDIGLLGIVESKGEARVLLRLEDGAVDIHNLGTTLPDGRHLDSLGETTLSLRGENTGIDKLLLFPEVVSSDLEETSTPGSINERTEKTNEKSTEVEPRK
jgi:hypothetical protein